MITRIGAMLALGACFLAQPCLARGEAVAVVSARAPVSLSGSQIADIFLGRSTRLPDGRVAVPVDQAEESALRDQFYARYTGKSAAQVKAHWAKIIFTGRGQPPRQVANSVEAKNFVIGNPGAIAYIDSALVDGSVRVILP